LTKRLDELQGNVNQPCDLPEIQSLPHVIFVRLLIFFAVADVRRPGLPAKTIKSKIFFDDLAKSPVIGLTNPIQ
jgi:hypothetical protein